MVKKYIINGLKCNTQVKNKREKSIPIVWPNDAECKGYTCGYNNLTIYSQAPVCSVVVVAISASAITPATERLMDIMSK